MACGPDVVVAPTCYSVYDGEVELGVSGSVGLAGSELVGAETWR